MQLLQLQKESHTSLNFFSGFLFATAKVAYVTAMISLHIKSNLSFQGMTVGVELSQFQSDNSNLSPRLRGIKQKERISINIRLINP